jgi:hypothetical protein
VNECGTQKIIKLLKFAGRWLFRPGIAEICEELAGIIESETLALGPEAWVVAMVATFKQVCWPIAKYLAGLPAGKLEAIDKAGRNQGVVLKIEWPGPRISIDPQ